MSNIIVGHYTVACHQKLTLKQEVEGFCSKWRIFFGVYDEIMCLIDLDFETKE